MTCNVSSGTLNLTHSLTGWMHSRVMLPVVADVVEVCQTELFEAACERSDEVIVMTSSTYGRMRVSRCVQSDYGYIGCSADALAVVDSACSGRRRCIVAVPSAALETAAVDVCPGDLKLYLAASYRCLKGQTQARIQDFTIHLKGAPPEVERRLQLILQDSASPIIDILVSFHDLILIVITIVLRTIRYIIRSYYF